MWKDSETKIDYLNFDYLKMILKDIITDDSLSPASIGIYGDWGSGKSSLMEMLQDEFSDDQEIVCIKFNGWLFEGYDDAKISFLGTILDELNEKKNFLDKAKDIFTKLYKNLDLLKLASTSLKTGINYAITGAVAGPPGLLTKIIVDLKDKIQGVSEGDIEQILKDISKPEEFRKNIKDFRKDFKELLNILDLKKVIIFIDELDRCNSQTIIETLEAIRLFLFTEKTTFIIGADERHVQNAVEQKFKKIEGSGINIGKEYLEKLIQYPVKIPQLSRKEMNKYITCLFLAKTLNTIEFNKFIKILNNNSKDLNFELSYNFIENFYPEIKDKVKEDIYLAERLSPVLTKGLNGNPRHCKRFLNTLLMREKMGKYKNVELKRDILSKIMILEYFYPYYFNEIFSFINEEGKIMEIEKVENDLEVPEYLKDFILDEKIIDWIKLEPSLSSIDLRPYLYFSEESFNIMTKIKYRLSPNAETILKNLLNGSDALQKQAMKDLNILTDMESNIIFENLKDTIYTNDDINIKNFNSLIKYTKIRTEHKPILLKILKNIPGSKIQFAIFPVLKETYNQDEKLLEIIKEWVKSNAKLTKAYERTFKKGEK
ncbi:KAP family P-loop NTPase fold protein [Cetobacterium sp. SF1]|uniref:KAP family P-loop NTPase fold protein n=1 Tax=Cetobacterium sp. SF1 TaxID=3417654 RepID=UPI003CF33A36